MRSGVLSMAKCDLIQNVYFYFFLLLCLYVQMGGCGLFVVCMKKEFFLNVSTFVHNCYVNISQ